jgi:hypothetical protein
MAQRDDRATQLVSEAPQSAEHSLPRDIPQGRFDLGSVATFQTGVVQRLHLDWWHLALVAFAIYYVLPGAAAVVGGRAFPPLGEPWFGAKAHAYTDYYATDLVYLVAALSASLFGAGLIILALTRFGAVVRKLIELGLITAPETALEAELASIKRWYGNRGVHVLLFVLSSSATYVILGLTTDPSMKGWWGHVSHGQSGRLAAFAAWLMMDVGGLAILRLALGLRALSRLFAHPVRLRPLHADGCNGFAVFGDYLVLLFFCAVAIAVTVWTPLYSRYLGVERHASIWLIGGFAMSAIPIILIWPLAACTLRISRARAERLASLEQVLHDALGKLESNLQLYDPKSLGDALSNIANARNALSEIFPANIFPFKPRIAGLLSASYGLQLVVFVQKAFETLRHL